MQNKVCADRFGRRDTLKLLAAAAAATSMGSLAAHAADKQVTGIITVANTPYTSTGEIDWDDLVKQMAFYDRCGVQGMVWPQGGGDAPLLTKDERMKGMELLASACKNLKLSCVLAVQGNTQAEMVEYATKAESLSPDAMMVQPPVGDQTPESLHAYFAALAGITKRPVIVQPSPQGVPDLDMLQRLAREFVNFGSVKEESRPVPDHMRADVAAKPIIKTIFGASGGSGWLYEARIGSDGESTALGAYADVTEAMWKAWQNGKREIAADAFSKVLLMINCEEQIPGTARYILQKRGVFKTMTVRKRGTAGQPVTISTIALKPDEMAEIDFRFSLLKPYLAKGA